MAIYDVKRLLTSADCDAALKTASATIESLEYKKATLEHRVHVHHRVVSKAREELRSQETELIVLNAGLSNAGDGRQAREYRCKITKVQWRIQLLQLRLEDYGEPALLIKELKLRQTEAALEDSKEIKAALEGHYAELQQALGNDEPNEVVPLIPLITSPQPAPRFKEMTVPKSADRSLKKGIGKRPAKGKPGMNRYT